MIVNPGFYPDIPADAYHADPCPEPSLSSSLAKVILTETPRHLWTKHPRLNPNFKPSEDEKFDLGKVAHEFILGKGGGFIPLEFDNWTTKAAREAREAVREGGKTPILVKDLDRVHAMTDGVFVVLDEMGIRLEECASEATIAWRDEIGGVWCRAMMDAFDRENGVIYDVKTTDHSLSDDSLDRLIANLGYDLSAEFYMRGVEAIFPDLAGRLTWRWVFVSAQEPHEMRVIEASGMTREIGAQKASLAIEKFAACMKSRKWPGYPRKITNNSYPAWAEKAWLEKTICAAE